MVDKQIINGLKYEQLTEDQLHDLSQWELVDIVLAYRNDLQQILKEIREIAEHPKGCCTICDRLDKILQKINEVIND